MAGDNHAGDGFDGLPVDVVTAATGQTIETLTGFPLVWEGASHPPKSLAIVGSHPATRELAPYEDETFDVWLFNEAPMKPAVYRRWDAAFQLHLPEVYRSQDNWVNKEHWPWLQRDHGERVIWMQDVDPDVPNSRRYPIEAVMDLLGPEWRYLRSTPAMALALGILLGYRHIQLWGSDLTSNTEYGYQAINYAFWIGFAKGCGINLEMRCWQDEFNQPIYGYEGELQVPQSFYQLRIDDAEPVLRQSETAVMKLQDRLTEAMRKHDYGKVAEFSINLQEMAVKTGEVRGALGEARRYYERTNPVSRQEYERVAAQAQIDVDSAKHDLYHTEGVVSYVWNVWKMTGHTRALQQLRDFMKKKTEQAFEVGRLLGVYRENLQYQAEYDNLVTAAGGARAVSQAEKVLVGNK